MSSAMYQRLKRRLLRDGRLFEDPDFPATSQSLGSEARRSRGIVWRRPKELTPRPEFIVDGLSRLDLHQGELGDCWLIAGAACLASTYPHLMERVMPFNQSFDTDYAGVFQFYFWEFGSWKEVLVDDRLPTSSWRPVYGHNRTRGETNEFWGALLEKAYAKFKGGYQNLVGGFINDALVDFTGGVSERFDLKSDADKLRPVLYDLMYRTAAMASLMGCSIRSEVIGETALSNGLYAGHAYSITQIATVTVMGRRVPLLRLRNPWGKCEWNGPWGDSSRLWSSVPSDEKKALGVLSKEDGEFWMEYKDWLHHFDDLDICHLSPDAHTRDVANNLHKRSWEVSSHHSEWIRGVSAGGCGNSPYERLFWTNPQFAVTLSDSDDADGDGKCTMLVSLMQKRRRRHRAEEISISYHLYTVSPYFQLSGPSDRGSDDKVPRRSQDGPVYKNSREVTGHHRVTPGAYLIIPTTYQPHQEAEFFLRIYSEKATKTEEVDQPSVIEKPLVPEDDVFRVFTKYAGVEGKLDATELQAFLGVVYKHDFQGSLSIDVCRSLVAMMDSNRSGLLDYGEVRQMLKELDAWKNAFRAFDKDGSGDIDAGELGEVFRAIGFRLSRTVRSAIVRRFVGKKHRLGLTDFVHCCAKIATMYSIFWKNASKSEPRKLELTLEEWLTFTMIY